MPKGSGSPAVLMWSQKVDRLMGALVNVKAPDVLIDVPDSFSPGLVPWLEPLSCYYSRNN